VEQLLRVLRCGAARRPNPITIDADAENAVTQRTINAIWCDDVLSGRYYREHGGLDAETGRVHKPRIVYRGDATDDYDADAELESDCASSAYSDDTEGASSVSSFEYSDKQCELPLLTPALPSRKKAPAMPVTPGTRYWLADTGCPVDLVGRPTLPAYEADRVEQAAISQNFDTANGSLPADQTTCMQVEGLPEAIDPYVLENTPDVISIGKRCVRYGYGFHWEPWSLKPYLVLPKAKGGGKLTLVSIGDVPYLADNWNPDGLKKSSRPACPAPVARRIPKRASSCPATVGDQEGIKEEQEEKHCEVPAEEIPIDDKWDPVPREPVPPPPEAPDEFKRPARDSRSKAFLMSDAKSLDHLMDHSKFNPYCRACVEARAQRKAKKKGGLVNQDTIPAEWGVLTGDHFFPNEKTL
jgi:hypothetical protein